MWPITFGMGRFSLLYQLSSMLYTWSFSHRSRIWNGLQQLWKRHKRALHGEQIFLCHSSLKTLLFLPGAHQQVEEGGVDRVQELFIQSRSQRNMFALSDKPFHPIETDLFFSEVLNSIFTKAFLEDQYIFASWLKKHTCLISDQPFCPPEILLVGLAGDCESFKHHSILQPGLACGLSSELLISLLGLLDCCSWTQRPSWGKWTRHQQP